ncbi:MAG: RHS repeat-associated core domain-containing protein [Gemmatimonadales bacterium]
MTPRGGRSGNTSSADDAGTTRTYTYDRAGNQTGTTNAGVTWAYTYDALNRLVSATRAGVLIARYGYDVLGRRIAKRVYSNVSGGTVGETRFVYHGQDVAFETTPTDTIGWSYTWGPGTDELVAADSGGQHYYAVRDKLGSVRGLVGRDGSWKFTERFRPYGTSLATTGTRVALRYRWTGREWDAELGWYFHRSRYYDPGQRRFVQEDPIGYGGGANLYAYVAGNALEAVDPSGKYMERCPPKDGGDGSGGGGASGLAGIGMT